MNFKRGAFTYGYLGQGIGLSVTHRGHKIFVSVRDATISPHLIFDGTWEPNIERCILRLLKPGQVVVEAGANMGYHTLAMAHAVGATGTIHAFEANPVVFDLLIKSIAVNGLNGQVRTYNLALAEQVGEQLFRYSDDGIGGGHITNYEGGPGHVLHVPGTTLDSALSSIPRIDLLRMDVEGFEPKVLAGAKNILERSTDVIIVMEWSVPMMQGNCDINAFIQGFMNSGFSAYRIQENSELTPISADDLLNAPHCEVVFSRRKLPLHAFNTDSIWDRLANKAKKILSDVRK